MKIVRSLKWLLGQAQKCKVLHYKSVLLNNPTPPTCSNYSVKTTQRNPFTNADRPCSQTELNLDRLDLPLQVELKAARHQNHGRVYSGNNPSVTTILDATRPKNELFALLNWRRGLIKQLGEEGYNEKVTKIKNSGTTFHQAIKQFLLTGIQPALQESNTGHWASVQHVLSDIDQIIALESVVVHPQLQYGGTLDGIISYQGKLCVIDWKTSQRKRIDLKDCFSYPHQIVAYAGAVNYDYNYDPIQINHGLLVLAYPDGSPADTIWITQDTCEHYWQGWLSRLELYHQPITSHTSVNNSCHSNQGSRMRDLAQNVNGVPSAKPSLLQDSTLDSMEYGGKDGDIHINIAEWSDSIIDVIEQDPSTCEFD